MNRIKKSVTVRFFSVEAKDSFFKNFESNFISNQDGGDAKVFNLRKKKYLLKTGEASDNSGVRTYFITVVKERNTWQAKATIDGTISGIHLNQGIIGDPYFFYIIPERKILCGFTTGPSVSLKSVGKTMLDQFNNDRLDQVGLNLIPKEKEFGTLRGLSEYSSLHFKINSSSLTDVSDDAPQLIKDLSVAPYLENEMQLSLDLVLDELSDKAFSKENVLEIVNYLSDHEGCSLLKVKGFDSEGDSIHLDFANAFFNYKTEIETRNRYIDEKTSIPVLESALIEFLKTSY